MSEIAVLDSSAILTVHFGEPGADLVLPLLASSLVSTVNLAEVHTKLLRRGVEPHAAWEQILSMGSEHCPFSEEQARLTAELISQTRRYGLSLGDRACLALAIQRKATVYTTDKAWKSLSLGIEIEVIR